MREKPKMYSGVMAEVLSLEEKKKKVGDNVFL